MKILIISALFPPNAFGGAENSAANMAYWLRDQGHEVAVYMAAKNADQVTWGTQENGLTIYRVLPPHIYSVANFQQAPAWKKPLWHLQDHLDPRNKKPLARILDDFKPDHVRINFIQGLGYNAVTEIAKRNIPTTFMLHDIGLACIRMSMFKNGAECQGQCPACTCSTRYKEGLFNKFQKIGYCSPSKANLDAVKKYFKPLAKSPHAVTLNPNAYPPATAKSQPSKVTRFAYVGRLHSTKGVDLLLEVAEKLAQTHPFHLTIIGGGPDEKALRTRYEKYPWCTFTGHVTQADVSNHMVNTDVLCIPSIWLENSPGVVIHALMMGVAVLGSNKGGIPELVQEGKNGHLVEVGNPAAWLNAMQGAVDNPTQVKAWKAYAQAHAADFRQDALAHKMVAFMEGVAGQKFTSSKK